MFAKGGAVVTERLGGRAILMGHDYCIRIRIDVHIAIAMGCKYLHVRT